MAYLIFSKTDNSLYKIAANDTDKNNLNIIDDQYTIKDVTDSEFNSVRNEEKIPELSGDTVTFTDLDTSYDNPVELQAWIDNVIKLCDEFVSATNQANPNYDAINTYNQYLKGFDTTLITYPLNTSWEQYCADNGTVYFNTLQLP
tara:strand:+ start:296 stop:730 length:435 start_codon:yes stop_codon:yes gene_type:complete